MILQGEVMMSQTCRLFELIDAGVQGSDHKDELEHSMQI